MSNINDFVIKDSVLIEYTGDSEDVVIPDGVKKIGVCAFYDCKNMTSLEIPHTVTCIDNDAFCGCLGLKSITVDENNNTFKDIDGNLYSKDGKTLIQYAIAKNSTNFIIPIGVETIGNASFCDCTNLMSLVISKNVKTIDDCAFLRCKNLTSIEMLDGLKTIGESAFRGCISLTSIEIPNSMTSIGTEAFYECKNLVITTPAGSYAEQYAKENGIMVKLI